MPPNAQPAKTVLGWSDGRNRWDDQTGTYHLMITFNDEATRAACDPYVRTGGQVERVLPAMLRDRRCLRCVRCAQKMERQELALRTRAQRQHRDFLREGWGE